MPHGKTVLIFGGVVGVTISAVRWPATYAPR